MATVNKKQGMRTFTEYKSERTPVEGKDIFIMTVGPFPQIADGQREVINPKEKTDCLIRFQ